MKNLFVMLFLGVVSMHSQTVTYVPSTENIPNPERGFYHNLSTGIVTGSYPLLNQSTLIGYRTNEKITVIQRLFYLNQFISSPISDAYLANIQSDFNAIRNAGLKVIIRFAYSSSETATPRDANKAQILAHIQQVAPLIKANKDVISVYQYGWIGCWGETYYSSQSEFGSGDYTAYTSTQLANRKEVLDAMMNATPIEIPVQIRYVYNKQKMYPSGNDRIGLYNDAFLNQWGDSGTFLVSGASGSPSATDSNYLISTTASAPMTGETDGVNSPRTDCTNAMFEMDKYNWSLLNRDYLAANFTSWVSQGCYSEIQNRLGYRFELLNSNITNNALTINLQNVGYSTVFTERQVFLVLKNQANTDEYFFKLSTNIKLWKNGVVTQIIESLNYNIPNGKYDSYLYIPDNVNRTVPYSIQFANTGIWDSAKGYNKLLQTVTINSNLAVQVFLNNNQISVVGADDYSIKVYDLTGKLVSNSLDISNLQKSIYIVKVKSNGMIFTQKIAKTRD